MWPTASWVSPQDVRQGHLKPNVSKRDASFFPCVSIWERKALSCSGHQPGWTLYSSLCLTPQSILIILPSNSMLDLPTGPRQPPTSWDQRPYLFRGAAVVPDWFPAWIPPSARLPFTEHAGRPAGGVGAVSIAGPRILWPWPVRKDTCLWVLRPLLSLVIKCHIQEILTQAMV